MTVSELIKELSKYPPDLNVVVDVNSKYLESYEIYDKVSKITEGKFNYTKCGGIFQANNDKWIDKNHDLRDSPFSENAILLS